MSSVERGEREEPVTGILRAESRGVLGDVHHFRRRSPSASPRPGGKRVQRYR